MNIGPKETALRALRAARAAPTRPQVRRNENPAKVPPKNKGGRPKKANALSNVERQRAYRARLKEAKA